MSPARFALLAALVYAALLADTAIGPRLALGEVRPDFTLLLLIVWLLRTRSTLAPLVAGVVGGIVDLVAADRVGPGIAAGALAGYLVPRLAAKLPTRNLLVEAAAVGGGTFGVGLLLCGAAFLAAELPQGITAAGAHLVGTAAYTGAAAIPFLLLRNWLLGSSLRPSWRLAS